MHQDEETHDQLMRAFAEYFKANQRWINKGTRQAGLEARYWLAQIRIIARDRRAHIQEYRHWLDSTKAQLKAAQDQSNQGTPNAN
jgi:hypothetical protein